MAKADNNSSNKRAKASGGSGVGALLGAFVLDTFVHFVWMCFANVAFWGVPLYADHFPAPLNTPKASALFVFFFMMLGIPLFKPDSVNLNMSFLLYDFLKARVGLPRFVLGCVAMVLGSTLGFAAVNAVLPSTKFVIVPEINNEMLPMLCLTELSNMLLFMVSAEVSASRFPPALNFVFVPLVITVLIYSTMDHGIGVMQPGIMLTWKVFTQDLELACKEVAALVLAPLCAPLLLHLSHRSQPAAAKRKNE